MRAAVKRYVLGRPKLRQSWNKYNLYNIMKFESNINYQQATFFQQKWAAKGMTRAYHGEHVQEKRWNRLFSRRLYSAVEMSPEYLAAHDGSEQAEGRGSGKHHPPDSQRQPVSAYTFSSSESARQRTQAKDRLATKWKLQRMRPGNRTVKMLWRQPLGEMTPYMQMAFAPMERRLEFAMFRAMFASSPRQARQFCIHGAVKVNGKKMKYGSYMLNPGDLFEVDPDKVLYATGKDKNEAKLERAARRRRERDQKRKVRGLEEGEESEETEETEESEEAVAEAKEDDLPDLTDLPEAEREKEQRRRVRALITSATNLLKEDPDMGAKRKQELRAFLKNSKKALGNKKHMASSVLMEELGTTLSKYRLDGTTSQVLPAEDQKPQADDSETPVQLTAEDQAQLAELLAEHEAQEQNPVDDTKPYATPWEPRKFLKPFAFIPRYLEVNQNVCAAVYLRHPVARRGLAEVPTPFPYDVSQLAYTWYLRRR